MPHASRAAVRIAHARADVRDRQPLVRDARLRPGASVEQAVDVLQANGVAGDAARVSARGGVRPVVRKAAVIVQRTLESIDVLGAMMLVVMTWDAARRLR